MFIGIMILYVIHPEPKVIVKYPTIDKVSDTLYKDDKGTCYSYEKKEVNC